MRGIDVQSQKSDQKKKIHAVERGHVRSRDVPGGASGRHGRCRRRRGLIARSGSQHLIRFGHRDGVGHPRIGGHTCAEYAPGQRRPGGTSPAGDYGRRSRPL